MLKAIPRKENLLFGIVLICSHLGAPSLDLDRRVVKRSDHRPRGDEDSEVLYFPFGETVMVESCLGGPPKA